MNRNSCIFCQSDLLPSTKSNEHVIPKWIQKLISINELEIAPTHSKPDGTVVSTRHHLLANLLEGRICKNCNNGWMSDLENSTIPIIRDLLELKSEIVDLDFESRLVLARWATKTAYMLNSASNYNKDIPSAHYTSLMNDDTKLPDRVFVFAQQHHPNKKFSWIQSPTWKLTLTSSKSKDIIDLTKESYKTSLQFGNILFLVGFLPEYYIPCIWKGIHVPLYPKYGQIFWYERADFPWYDSEKAIDAFHLGLEVVHNIN